MVSSWSFRVPFRMVGKSKVLRSLLEDRKVAVATHNMFAYRCGDSRWRVGYFWSGLEKKISLKTHACCLFDDFFTKRLSKTAWALFTWGPSYVSFRDRDVFGTASGGSPFSLAWLQVSWRGTWCAGCWQWGWWRGPPGIELSAQDRDDKVFYT